MLFTKAFQTKARITCNRLTRKPECALKSQTVSYIYLVRLLTELEVDAGYLAFQYIVTYQDAMLVQCIL